MSRTRKPHRTAPLAPAAPQAPMPGRPHTRNGASPPPGDKAADLVSLRAVIAETRRELDARLDALAELVDRLLPEQEAAAPTPRPQPPANPRPKAPAVRIGDEVYVPHLGGTYTVVEVAPSGQTFKVQAGRMRVQVRHDQMRALTGETPEPVAPSSPAPARPQLSADIPEIDLHGFSERDALITLELFLHHAFAQRTPRVRVIHGKGDGILRAAVRRELTRSTLVRVVEAGPQFQGDDGVTLAELDL